MPLLRRKEPFESTKMLFLLTTAISLNPDQPRTRFSWKGLEELAISIQELGVLQPPSVRRSKNDSYELVSGGRRLRASHMAGLAEVPCILVSVDSQGSSLLALVENPQRQNLNFVEEATALTKLIEIYHLLREKTARHIGKSQSAVANGLHLLHLPPDVLTLLWECGRAECHARALLRLEESEFQRIAARHVAEQGFTMARTEEYVEALPHPVDKPTRKRPAFVIKNVRLFLNAITRGLSMMKNAGVQASCKCQKAKDSTLLTIAIPRQRRTVRGGRGGFSEKMGLFYVRQLHPSSFSVSRETIQISVELRLPPLYSRI